MTAEIITDTPMEDTRKEEEPQHSRIIAVRHGRTTWNTERRNQGNVDTDTIEELMIPYLENLGIRNLKQPDYFLLSKLRRTHQTAKAIERLMGWSEIPTIVDGRLNERGWGVAEGLIYEDAHEKALTDPLVRELFPGIKTVEEVRALWDSPSFRLTGGESLEQVAARVKPAIFEHAAARPGEEGLMVSHIGVLLSLGLDPHTISSFEVDKVNGISMIIPTSL